MNNNIADLNKMADRLRVFNQLRDWDQFHSPRNLAMALSVESAELLECFLWAKDGEPIPEQKKEHVAEEAADVLICLLNFCTRANIDIYDAFLKKIQKNEQKYPVEKARGSREKYTDLQ